MRPSTPPRAPRWAVGLVAPAGEGTVLALLGRSARAWHGGELSDDVAVLLLKADPSGPAGS